MGRKWAEISLRLNSGGAASGACSPFLIHFCTDRERDRGARHRSSYAIHTHTYTDILLLPSGRPFLHFAIWLLAAKCTHTHIGA